ncbi:hypothetical protein [Flavobacterium chungnamense]|uniref:Uncharacterized protein n=1 Tax=Flavobacterium chungnamense TaxID=706182 RepID=A0ABP7V4Q5_9FLAO
MSIQHKFYQTNFGNGFETHNAILDITPYTPEVMIVGTFNPNTPNANFADFFYGRNYFWTGFKNLFLHNGVLLENSRMPPNGNPPAILNPTLPEIFNLCTKLKLTFSDLVLEVLHKNNPNYHLLNNDNVIFNGLEYNLIQDGQNNDVGGLQQLNLVGQVNWNTKNIIKYLCENPQIKTIYFTRQPTGIWAAQWNLIINHECIAGRLTTNIFTPSGQGLRGTPRMNALLKHWVHNRNPNFGWLDNNWLTANGVNLINF